MRFPFHLLFFLTLFCLPFQSCTQDEPLTSDGSNLVIRNARIYTVNAASPWAEAMAVQNGKIVYIGSDAGVEDFIDENTTVRDLNGKMVMPGIHDVHTHPLEAMSPLGVCELPNDEVDPENFIGEIATCSHDQPANVDFLFGSGFSVYTMFDAERAPRLILDEAVPDKPAIIMEETSHAMWVNSMALEIAGIDATTPNPQGGIIFKDENTGEPTGLLMDAAGDLLLDKFWTNTAAIKELNYEGLKEALKLMAENGITSVCEGRTYWRRDFQDAWFRAEQEGVLTTRANLCLWGYPHLDDASQLATLKSMFHRDSNSLVQVDQIKLYADGIVPNTTAAMLEPYNTDLGIIPGNKGLNYFTQNRMAAYITELEKIGFDFHIHAIGDRGIHESLNAIEAARLINGNVNARHRLTHVEVLDMADVDRFKELNVVADCQVAGDFTQPANWAENEEFIGVRSNNAVPLKTLYDAGATIALSSDWDVSDLNPFVGMQNALTRAPQNLPNLEAVIKAYTITGAYVMRQEDRTGSLEVGKMADFIILDKNIFDIATTQIASTKVLATYLSGATVFER